MDLTIILLILLAFILLTLHLYNRYSRWGRLLAKIPGNREWPILGHTFELGSMDSETSFRFLRLWCKRYKRIYKMKMFQVAAVNISHPDDIETIYSTTTHINKQLPYNFLRNWLCEGLLVSNGEKWKQRRKLLTPAFHFNILKRYCPTFNEQAELFLDCVKKEVGKDRTNIRPLVTKATLSTMIETAMGLSVSTQKSSITDYCRSVQRFGDIMLKRYFTAKYHLNCIYKLTSTWREEKKLFKAMHEFTKKIIDDRRKFRNNNNVAKFENDNEEMYVGKQRLAMLDLLLEEETVGKIDEQGIREEVETFLFEGHDTTAAALTFFIMRIANEPKVQEKIYEELQQIFEDSDRAATPNDLNKMKYLECCIKESLRLYPSVFFMARFIKEDVELGGYLVPAGTIIHVHIYDLHHDPEVYPDPEKFDPDRFLPEVAAARHPYAYIPFSAGPRNCIGQKFAMMEMKTLLSGLLRQYHLEPVTRPKDVILVCDLVLRSKDPMYVRFTPRKDSVSCNNHSG